MRRIGFGYATVKQRAADEHCAWLSGDVRVVRRSIPLVLLAEQRPVSAVAAWARQHSHAPRATNHPVMYHEGCVKPNSQANPESGAAR